MQIIIFIWWIVNLVFLNLDNLAVALKMCHKHYLTKYSVIHVFFS